MITEALRNIYRRDFDPKGDIEPLLFRELLKVFDRAAGEGFAQSAFDPEEAFRNAIRSSNAVFSAFKVHRMQNDMARMLIDSNGDLKPFEQWKNDVQGIASHQCERWLQTEYDTAVLRAHQAADWQQFEAEKDVLPNLKWMPSTSLHPGEDHRIFWGTVRPVDDPFWTRHRPGDRWNCKCSLSSTDEPVTALPKEIGRGDNPQPGLDNNPGKDGRIFSDSHSYFPKSCGACPFYKPSVGARLRSVFHDRVKDCYNCPYIKGCIDRVSESGFKLERTFKNGGQLYVHPDVEKKADYHAILAIAIQFAKEGHEVRITPRLHFKSEEYQEIYASLMGTKYERKCPDFQVDGTFYEYEGFVKPWSKKKVGRMLSHGFAQSSRVVINNTKGCADRFIRKQIMARINLPGQAVDEVWIYEKGKVRLFYKDGIFYKNNGGT